MISDKIFYILQSFNIDDWDNFGKFVSSPYLVQGNFSKRIFDPLKKYFLSTKDKEKITLNAFEKQLGKIRIREKYAENSYSSKLSIFYNNLEQYLTLNNFRSDSIQFHKYLLFEFIKRKLDFNTESEIQYFSKKAEKGIMDTYDTINLQQIFFTEAVYFLQHNKIKKAFELFYKQSERFMSYFLEGFTYHLLELKNINKYEHDSGETLLQKFSNHLDLDSFIPEIEKIDSDVFNITLVTFYLLRISENKNIETNIEKLKNVFFTKEESYGLVFRVFVYIELSAAYQKLISKGETKYYKDNFELLKRQDSKNLIIHIQKGIFALNFFFSCINVGLEINETKWVEDFIKKYYEQLPEDIKQNEYNVGIAMVQFHKKEYEESLNSLGKCRNIFYSKSDFRYSILMLKILYETSRIEEAYLEMDRLSHRITNNKGISQEIKQQARFFIQSYSKLLRISLDPEKTNLDELFLSTCKTDEPIPEKEWFFRKIEELKDN